MSPKDFELDKTSLLILRELQKGWTGLVSNHCQQVGYLRRYGSRSRVDQMMESGFLKVSAPDRSLLFQKQHPRPHRHAVGEPNASGDDGQRSPSSGRRACRSVIPPVSTTSSSRSFSGPERSSTAFSLRCCPGSTVSRTPTRGSIWTADGRRIEARNLKDALRAAVVLRYLLLEQL